MALTRSDVNIRDVASEAGVSTGTVSRVLRGANGVRAENAARVHRAVRELGYAMRGRRPLGSGRKPQRRRTGNLGLYIPNASPEWASHPLAALVSRGFDRACSESGFHCVTEYSEPDRYIPRMVAEQKVDGLIVKGSTTDWIDCHFGDLPIIGVNLHQPGLPFDQVNCDDYQSGYMAAEYLWQHGHRRIAFVSSDGTHPMILMRYQGYERFMRLFHCFDQDQVHLSEEPQSLPSVPQSGFSNYDDVLQKWKTLPDHRRPTATIAANDWSAAGIYNSAAQLNLRIPSDLSVLAFDNNIELCNMLKPNLTSFKVALEQATYFAAMRLIQKIDFGIEDIHPVVQSIAGELVERRSVRTLNAANLS